MTDPAGFDFNDKLRPQRVAALLGISDDTLRRLSARDATFPRFIQVSPRVRYMVRRDLELWLSRRRLQSLEQGEGVNAE